MAKAIRKINTIEDLDTGRIYDLRIPQTPLPQEGKTETPLTEADLREALLLADLAPFTRNFSREMYGEFLSDEEEEEETPYNDNFTLDERIDLTEDALRHIQQYGQKLFGEDVAWIIGVALHRYLDQCREQNQLVQEKGEVYSCPQD